MKRISRKSLVTVFTVLIIVVCISLILANISEKPGTIERGKVLSIVRQIKTPTDEDPFPGQIVQVKVKSGKFHGQIINSTNVFTGNPRYDIPVTAGQRVILNIEEDEDGNLKAAFITDVARDFPLIFLSLAFVISLVLLGGKKGLKALLSLIFTLIVFFKALLPLLLNGFHPLLTTIILAIVVAGVSLILTVGWRRKTLAAFLGISVALICAGLLAFTFGHIAILTGLGSAEGMILSFAQQFDLDFQGILFAAMVFGALGALIDMAINITNRIDEVYFENPIATTKELFMEGMELGRNMMGSISNILITAYLGCALPLMLILAGYQPSFFKVINLDAMATEVIRALVGGLGLFIVIPLTAICAAWLVYEEVMLRYYP